MGEALMMLYSNINIQLFKDKSSVRESGVNLLKPRHVKPLLSILNNSSNIVHSVLPCLLNVLDKAFLVCR